MKSSTTSSNSITRPNPPTHPLLMGSSDSLTHKVPRTPLSSQTVSPTVTRSSKLIFMTLPSAQTRRRPRRRQNRIFMSQISPPPGPSAISLSISAGNMLMPRAALSHEERSSRRKSCSMSMGPAGTSVLSNLILLIVRSKQLKKTMGSFWPLIVNLVLRGMPGMNPNVKNNKRTITLV